LNQSLEESCTTKNTGRRENGSASLQRHEKKGQMGEEISNEKGNSMERSNKKKGNPKRTRNMKNILAEQRN
jgi:hypothetical protein